MYINVSNQHVCVHHLYMYCVFDMHYCTCADMHVYVYTCMSTLKCMYTCSVIMHVCILCM